MYVWIASVMENDEDMQRLVKWDNCHNESSEWHEERAKLGYF